MNALHDLAMMLHHLLGTKQGYPWAIRCDNNSTPVAIRPNDMLNVGINARWHACYLWTPTGPPITEFYAVGIVPTGGSVFQVKLQVAGTPRGFSTWVTLDLRMLTPIKNLPSLESKLAEIHKQLEDELICHMTKI